MKLVITESQWRLLNEIEEFINEGGEKDYSVIQSAFIDKGYIKNDNIKLTRGLYQPKFEYRKRYGSNGIVKGTIFDNDGPGPVIELINLDFPDFSECKNVETHGITKSISITNENIVCILESIDNMMK